MRTLNPMQHDIPAFPIQNMLTGPLRQAAAKANRPEYLALWAGQAASMSRGMPAAQLIARLTEETVTALQSSCR
jgi:nitronate monooxygenase